MGGEAIPPFQSLPRNCEHLSIWNRMVSYLSNDEKRAREKQTVRLRGEVVFSSRVAKVCTTDISVEGRSKTEFSGERTLWFIDYIMKIII
jgi:hypothetical protein